MRSGFIGADTPLNGFNLRVMDLARFSLVIGFVRINTSMSVSIFNRCANCFRAYKWTPTMGTVACFRIDFDTLIRGVSVRVMDLDRLPLVDGATYIWVLLLVNGCTLIQYDLRLGIHHIGFITIFAMSFLLFQRYFGT